MIFNFIVLLAVLCVINAASTGFIQKELMNKRHDFSVQNKPEPSTPHEVIFAVKQLNLDKLEKEVLERSTPGSPKYQQWMKFDEVGALITNHEGAQATLDWLAANNIKYSWMSKRKEYIKATAPISVWEKLFDTTFFNYLDENPNKGYDGYYVRAPHYSLPVDIAPHVDAVFNTAQVPPIINKKFHRKEGSPFRTDFRPNLRRVQEAMDSAQAKAGSNQVTTVAYLDEFYNIPSNVGSADLAQSVFETSTEYFAQSDLKSFQEYYNLYVQAAEQIGNHNTTACNERYNCDEGNLDIQYIMGLAQHTVSTYWYVASTSTSNPYVSWVTTMADETNPPQANSMSWGSIEQSETTSTLNSFNTEAMKLSSMGVTITISSGDDGVSNSNCACTTNSGSSQSSWTGAGSWTGQGYFPNFPATCPYVTALGASMGAGGYPPAVGGTELACQSQLGGVITSGGGFSTYFATPSWQTSATSAYLLQFNATAAPASGYNKNGRGIPDMAMLGVYYQVMIGGSLTSLFGTSCSSPVTAALVSLINAGRATSGKPAVGYMNPTLYSNTGKFNDITSGSNNCCAYTGSTPSQATCCTSGFQATAGWDPVTGLGSIDYDNFAAMF